MSPWVDNISRFLFCEQVFILLKRISHYAFCLVERAVESAAAGVEMAAAVEEVGCHLVAGEVVYRAQRHPDGVETDRRMPFIFSGSLTSPSASPLMKWKSRISRCEMVK